MKFFIIKLNNDPDPVPARPKGSKRRRRLKPLALKKNEHMHKCPRCGNIWKHSPFNLPPNAHTCACCGAEQYTRHYA